MLTRALWPAAALAVVAGRGCTASGTSDDVALGDGGSGKRDQGGNGKLRSNASKVLSLGTVLTGKHPPVCSDNCALCYPYAPFY